jgi:hypothetical protein
MNPIVGKAWLAALRSGHYKQARGRLANGELTQFCCLGVLCDLHRKETNGEWVLDICGDNTYLGNTGSLPFTVSEWAGLIENSSVSNPVVEFNDRELDLAYLNDSGNTFKEIADTIEDQLIK